MSKISVNNGALVDFPSVQYEYITTSESAARVLEKIERYPVVEVDTETTGFDALTEKVVLLQLGVAGKAFVFDVRKGNVDAKIFKPLLEDDNHLKILQNAIFDYKMLRSNFGIEINRMYDTMLAEQLLFLGLNPKANLQYLAAKYFHLNMPKDAAPTFKNYNQEYQEYQLRYAANDVSILRDIYNLQLPQLKQQGLTRVAKLEFEFVKPLAEMELNGIALDVGKWRGILDEMTVERDLLQSKVSNVLNQTIDQTTLFGVSLLNLDSPLQLVRSLNTLGIPVDSTDVKELVKYKNNPIVELLLDYRKYEKFITTYGEPMINRLHPKTNRLHTDFTQMVSTGRLSSSNPNLQNIPKEQRYRACFVAMPGYKLITCDMSQAELRILADYSRDPAFLEAYATGKDLHTITACEMFGVTPEEVDRDKKLSDEDPNKKGYREATKAINFGLIYGLTEVGLARRLGCSEEKARALINKYFNKYRKIKEYLDKSGRSAVINRYSTTISGRKRFYKLPDPSDTNFNRLRGSVERAGKNHPIQGSNADTIKQSMIYVNDRIKNYDAKLILTVHDEVVVEVREDQSEEIAPMISQCLVDGFAEFFKTVKMEAASLIGDCWLKG